MGGRWAEHRFGDVTGAAVSIIDDGDGRIVIVRMHTCGHTMRFELSDDVVSWDIRQRVDTHRLQCSKSCHT